MQNSKLAPSLFARIKQGGLCGKALQWRSLVSLSQYRLPYEVTHKTVSAPAKVLDWGCGNGHFSYFLTSQGIQTVGYSFDPAPDFLLQESLFKHVKAGTDPVTLPFESGSFDVVFSIGVLEHVHETGGEQKASVREIHRILKKNGLFLCFHLPNQYTWIEFIVRRLNRLTGLKMHEHSRLFTYKSLAALLDGTSFRIEQCGRYNFFPRNIMGKLPSWLGESQGFANGIDAADSFFGKLLPFLCQNWFFVIRKS